MLPSSLRVADANGAVILLRAVGVIREIVVQRDAIELRGGLLILSRPGSPAVGADVGAAVVAFDHPVGIIGRDPEIVIVAVRRANGRVRSCRRRRSDRS